MNAAALNEFVILLRPHFPAVALCAARLIPVALLCPVLGGQAAPTSVKLGLVLSLAFCIHFAGGVRPAVEINDPLTFFGLVLKELGFGTAIGLIAALPFDAARIGGRFIDLFRGTSAEASLPMAGTRESATGDALYQMLVSLVCAAGILPLIVGALWRSFEIVRLGAYVPTESVALQVAEWTGATFATGLAVGAPIAAAALASDAVLGLASRAMPQLELKQFSAPVRILGGGATLWLGLGLISDRLLAGVVSSDGALRALFESVR